MEIQGIDRILGKSISREKELTTVAANRPLSIFCGAGISTEYGVPAWEGLLTALLVETLKKHLPRDSDDELRTKAAQLYAAGGSASPLLTARCAHNFLAADFAEAIRRHLYKNVHQEHHLDTTPLVDCLAKVVVQGRVADVVTYNYDDLLERALQDRYKCSVFKVEKGSDLREAKGNENATIYYVHGCVPYLDADPITSDIVLAEDDYHHLYAWPYDWRNRLQLDLLARTTALLLGLSVADPNLRRLLELSRRESGGIHYVVRKLLSAEDIMLQSKHIGIDLTEAAAEKLVAPFVELEEELVSDLGLEVIYVGEWSELPDLLERVFNLE